MRLRIPKKEMPSQNGQKIRVIEWPDNSLKTIMKIIITYDNHFEKEVIKNGNPDPIGLIEIVNIDQSGEEHSLDMRDWMCATVTRLLDASEAILEGEKFVITDHNGPTYLVFEPHDNSLVNITHCIFLEHVDQPEERLPYEETITVSRQDYLESTIQAGKEYIEKVTKFDPTLEKSAELQDLRDAIGSAENRLNTYIS